MNLKIHTRLRLVALAEKAKAQLRAMPLGEMGDWVEGPENPSGIPMRRIPPFPSYAASEDGVIFSLERTHLTRGYVRRVRFKAIKKSINPHGYYTSSLHIFGEDTKCIGVHRLMGYAFLGSLKPDPHGRYVDHKNRNRLDNRLANLRLVTSYISGMNRTPISRVGSESGAFCVYLRRNAWFSKMRALGENVYLGQRQCKDEAVSLWKEAQHIFWSTFDSP